MTCPRAPEGVALCQWSARGAREEWLGTVLSVTRCVGVAMSGRGGGMLC